jgi:hypothetical protein
MYKKPEIMALKKVKGYESSIKFTYYKSYNVESTSKNCAIHDINSLNLFQYMSGNLKINEKIISQFLHSISENYVKFLNL